MLYAFHIIALVFATTFIHAACTVLILGWLNSPERLRRIRQHIVARITAISAVVLLMSLAACLESMLWAGLYLMVDALPDLGTAFYFSLVTFTSLGYGDITLERGWRLAAAFESANGVVMFGWTTAVIVSMVQSIYSKSAPEQS